MNSSFKIAYSPILFIYLNDKRIAGSFITIDFSWDPKDEPQKVKISRIGVTAQLCHKLTRWLVDTYRRSLSTELRCISLSPNQNCRYKSHDPVCTSGVLVQASPLRSGRIRQADSPSQATTDLVSQSGLSQLSDTCADQVSQISASDVNYASEDQCIVGKVSCPPVQSGNNCESIRNNSITSQVQLDMFLSNLSQASDFYCDEGKARDMSQGSEQRLDGTTLAKRVRLAWSGQPAAYKWYGSMKDNTVIDYSAPYPYDCFGKKNLELPFVPERSGNQENFSDEAGNAVGCILEPKAQPPPSPPRRKRHGEEFKVSKFHLSVNRLKNHSGVDRCRNVNV